MFRVKTSRYNSPTTNLWVLEKDTNLGQDAPRQRATSSYGSVSASGLAPTMSKNYLLIEETQRSLLSKILPQKIFTEHLRDSILSPNDDFENES